MALNRDEWVTEHVTKCGGRHDGAGAWECLTAAFDAGEARAVAVAFAEQDSTRCDNTERGGNRCLRTEGHEGTCRYGSADPAILDQGMLGGLVGSLVLTVEKLCAATASSAAIKTVKLSMVLEETHRRLTK